LAPEPPATWITWLDVSVALVRSAAARNTSALPPLA
jgi:hypothetical protein